MANRKLAKLPNRVALASLVLQDALVPGGEIGGEEQAAERDRRRSCAQPGKGRPRPCRQRDEGEERQGQRQPPEARRDRPDIGQPHHPRPGGRNRLARISAGKAKRAARIRDGDDGSTSATSAAGAGSRRQAGASCVIASARRPPIAADVLDTDSAFRIATLYLLRRSIPARAPAYALAFSLRSSLAPSPRPIGR